MKKIQGFTPKPPPPKTSPKDRFNYREGQLTALLFILVNFINTTCDKPQRDAFRARVKALSEGDYQLGSERKYLSLGAKQLLQHFLEIMIGPLVHQAFGGLVPLPPCTDGSAHH